MFCGKFPHNVIVVIIYNVNNGALFVFRYRLSLFVTMETMQDLITVKEASKNNFKIVIYFI